MSKLKLTGVKWHKLQRLRARQRLVGNLAAIFLVIALLAMTDGLIAGMREGSTRLDILPGQQLAISGPAATKNPLPSDVIAKFAPDACPLTFQLEGFFTGYWFGSGMWRGFINAPEESSNAECRLSVSFRGMPAKSAQHYEIRLFADENARRESAFSLLTRYVGQNPFHLASMCGICGFLLGIVTYVLGRLYATGLRGMGLLSVYSPDKDGKAFICPGPPTAFVVHSEQYPVFLESGCEIGKAIALGWEKGKWRLEMGFMPPDGSLVAMRGFTGNQVQYQIKKMSCAGKEEENGKLS